MMQHIVPKKACVIGGGIAGASISRVLAAAGVQVTLLEKSNQLCSGSTWHAASLVTRFAGSPKLKKIHVRSLDLLVELEEKYGIGLHTPGSIRIVEKGNLDRLREAKQHLAMAALYDKPEYPTTLLSASEVLDLHPLIDIDQVECGLYTPHDGDCDATSLTNAVAKEAKAHGAKYRLNAHVTKIDSIANNQFAVHIEGDESPLEVDTIVNAAGLWSRNISDMMGKGKLDHPAFVIEHQYAITETVDAVKSLSQSGHNGGRLPVLRDLRGSSYIRQEGNGFLIGPYEDECVVRRDMPRGPPATFNMELFPDRLDRIEDNLLKGMELVPSLGEVGFRSVVNGPTIWTGDSLARCGRTKIPGYYDFNSLTYGIAQSLSLAEYLGYIMLNGEQPWDATDYFDPLRYGTWANDTYLEEKIKETYTYNNRTVYGSYENRSAGRTKVEQPYPLHEVFAKHGARFGAFGGSGCEVPLCFVTDGSDIDFHDQKKFSHFEWSSIAEDEAAHALENVALSYSSFSKIRAKGADAMDVMKDLTTGVLPSIKKTEETSDLPCRLTYCTTPHGRVQTEFTICKMDKSGQDWYLVGSRDHVRQDIAWLQQNTGTERDCAFEDVTDDYCVLHVCGPKSGELLYAVEPRSKGLNFMRSRQLENFGGLDGVNVQVFRVSFTGEMGYELHFPSNEGPRIHDLIWNHDAAKSLGLRHVGSAAINALRIERGFKFRADLDYTHYKEAGIMPFVAKKRSFLGKDEEDKFEPTKQSAMFTVKTDPGWEWSVVGDSPIYNADNVVVGYTTTSCWGGSSKKTVALGFILLEHNITGEEPLYIQTYGFKWPVTLLEKPILDVDRTVF